MHRTPVSRLKTIYASKERASTIDYVTYCMRRLYTHCGLVLRHDRHVEPNWEKFG